MTSSKLEPKLFSVPAGPITEAVKGASRFREMLIQSCRNVIIVLDREGSDAITMLCFLLIVMRNSTIVFDPYATDRRDIVQAIVDNYCVASTGKAEWYPVAFFLRDENGEVLGGLLGDIWAAWLHVRTLAVAAPVRGYGFGKELMKRAETYAIERGCTDAYLDTFSFEARPFYEKLGYRVFGTLENHPVGYQHYFMTKKLDSGEQQEMQ
jgi:GNAT superfamily N-acetyltransferase